MVGVIASLVERLKKWKANDHEEKVEQAIDRLMLVETFIMWYIQELEDLKAQLSRDPVLKQLNDIINKMMQQLWQLMRRWAKAKAEVIRAVREGLMRKERVIEGNGFTIWAIYHKSVIDLQIYLHGSGGDYAKVPSLGIPETILKNMRMGWRASDSSDHVDRYPIMDTNFTWQVIAWLITMPGAEASIYAEGISVSLNGIKPTWYLRVSGFEVE